MKLIQFCIALSLLLNYSLAFAHGQLGNRFFPATIAIEDPFAADELNLSTFVTEAPGNVWTTNPVLSMHKTVTSNVQFGSEASYLHIKAPHERALNGFDNFSISLLYQAYVNHACESIISVEMDWELGGTGSHIVDANSHSTLTPQILFAQGFGTLAGALPYARPLAITGQVGMSFQSPAFPVTNINYGLVFEYSLAYLATHVMPRTLPKWMHHVIPLVEVPITSCIRDCEGGKTTGSINPGVILFNEYGQIGAEAIIPINKASGNKVGYVVQLHLFLEDVFPNSIFRKPLF